MKFEKNAPVSGDNDKNRSPWQRFCAQLPTLLILARYVLPCVAVLVFFVMGFGYTVRASGGGSFYRISTWRLLWNTLAGTHDYLGGETQAAKNWFYGSLSVVAIFCFLCFLLALFLSALALYTAAKAFRAGHTSEQSNRMKVIFKIAFPNRLWLFLSNLLILIPAAYPHFYQVISTRFLLIGNERAIYVFANPPLVVLGVLVLLTLVLALVIPRYERSRHMNMFLVHHEEEPTVKEDLEEYEDEEDEE